VGEEDATTATTPGGHLAAVAVLDEHQDGLDNSSNEAAIIDRCCRKRVEVFVMRCVKR